MPNTREQIIAVGMRTVLGKGYNGCGIQEIAASAGLSKGSFYNYFESKEALGATDKGLCRAPTSTLNDTIRGGYDLDVVGHYARPDA